MISKRLKKNYYWFLFLNYDHFIRTTEEKHKELVTKSILSSESNGDIFNL
jgi:methionyl-tRNA synthetase